jgi:effector-binding domain-containing protein
MLRLRRSELQAQLDDDAARLAGVEARLRIIESEGIMPEAEVTIKSLPAVRVAELTDLAAGFDPESITPVISPLYDRLYERLRIAGLEVTGPGIAYYEPTDHGVVVHASAPVAPDASGDGVFTIVDLPAIDRAATILHHGPMDNVMPTLQRMARWIEANGLASGSAGYNRELYLSYGRGDPDSWVTELQEPLEG